MQLHASISPSHRAFIEKQHIFFTASAAAEGPINLSPKGLGGFRVLDENAVAYLDLTGSGNETAAYLKADGRLTIMFCAFQGPPLILRLYGRGRVLLRGDPEYHALLDGPFGGEEPVGARQIVVLAVEQVQTSCGYAVPNYVYKAERPSLLRWAEAQGEEGLREYRARKNQVSLAGFPTGFEEPSPPLRGRGQGEGGVSSTLADVAADRQIASVGASTPAPLPPSPQGGGGSLPTPPLFAKAQSR